MEGFSMRKSNKKGFTLVELVVVIAIIGVLAAILVPTMMNYVKKSRLKTANSNAKLVFTTVNNQSADLVAEGAAAKAVTFGPDKIVKVDKPELDPEASGFDYEGALKWAVYDALKDNGNGMGYAYFVVDANGDVTIAQWQTTKTTAKQITGQYPNAAKDVDAAEALTFGAKASS